MSLSRASCGLVFLVAVVVRAVELRPVVLEAVPRLFGLLASRFDGQGHHHQQAEEM